MRKQNHPRSLNHPLLSGALARPLPECCFLFCSQINLRGGSGHDPGYRRNCITTDPEFGAKAADVVGLYLNPPEKAIVVCVDEKPHIQALQRAQGYLRLPDGRAVNGFSHCYRRNGTTILFAALDVATGQVKTAHYTRRRRREFLDFMNEIVAANPNREIHVILDNLNTHKPKRDRWLKAHPHVQLHFTPTYSSWLNQVECWFSILSRAALRGASFASARQLRDAIDAFVETYDEKAVPFEWTKAMVESPHCTTERQHVASIEPTPVAFYPRDRQQSPEWCASALPA